MNPLALEGKSQEVELAKTRHWLNRSLFGHLGGNKSSGRDELFRDIKSENHTWIRSAFILQHGFRALESDREMTSGVANERAVDNSESRMRK